MNPIIEKLKVINPSKLYRYIDYKTLPNNEETITVDIDGKIFNFRQLYIAYTFPGYGFCHLLRNIDKNETDFSHILARGVLNNKIKTIDVVVENNHFFSEKSSMKISELDVMTLPNETNQIIIKDPNYDTYFHHFSCLKVEHTSPFQNNKITLTYMKSYNDVKLILDTWLDAGRYLTSYHWDLQE